MDLSHRLRRYLRSGLLPAGLVLWIAYFGYHVVQGDSGLAAFARLEQDLVRVQAQHREALAVRQKLEARVALLHPEHIDADMLDERARVVLGVAHPDEVLVYAE
ncbi:MAG: septum formation initiator family protein [Alphaproteobacteria bacterium]